ncbi:MAG: TVP38/TMEM64 family protein [Bryobacterales bacterium]|nr:TVP38/TMEM64 family protein [Bryobacterales bacterium]MDE0294620.1 TVP38/TMEM64 family protein [Bryobacterales bacterium]
MSFSGSIHRYANIIRGVSLLLIVASVILLARALPVDSGVQAFQSRISDLGAWAPLIFGVVYAIAATLLIPASALTLAGGAIFGLTVGTLTVWLSATTAAAMSFLIARYVARFKVEVIASRNPKFSAIDSAIGEGGWKIVALLRLSPAVPFNLQNYLYGLTAIRFWPCVGASAVFMLPGTFMYVYLGHLGGQGLAAASGGGAGRSAGQWALLVVGLLATIAVTVYVTRLANNAIRNQTAIAVAQPREAVSSEQAPPPGMPWGVIAIALAAMVLFSLALSAGQVRTSLEHLLGTPSAVLDEACGANPKGAAFDDSLLNTLLLVHVDDQGRGGCNSFRAEAGDLNKFARWTGKNHFYQMSYGEKLSLLINSCNSYTLPLIREYDPVASIVDIPNAEPNIRGLLDGGPLKRVPLATGTT